MVKTFSEISSSGRAGQNKQEDTNKQSDIYFPTLLYNVHGSIQLLYFRYLGVYQGKRFPMSSDTCLVVV